MNRISAPSPCTAQLVPAVFDRALVRRDDEGIEGGGMGGDGGGWGSGSGAGELGGDTCAMLLACDAVTHLYVCGSPFRRALRASRDEPDEPAAAVSAIYFME